MGQAKRRRCQSRWLRGSVVVGSRGKGGGSGPRGGGAQGLGGVSAGNGAGGGRNIFWGAEIPTKRSTVVSQKPCDRNSYITVKVFPGVNFVVALHYPPPSKNITGSFFVSGINFVGITGKIGNMVTGNNVWGITFHGITGTFGRVSAQCEAM